MASDRRVGDFALSFVPGATIVRGRGAVGVFTRKDAPDDVAGGRGSNLAMGAGQDAQAASAARAWAARLGGLDPDMVVWGQQVHGTNVAYVDSGIAAAHAGGEPLPATDALVTDAAGVAVGVLVADCVPVLVVAPDAVAVVHAGWRGLVAGIVEAAASELERRASGPLTGFIGPSIMPCCFEVGPETAEVFAQRWPATVLDFGGERPHVDLRLGVALALESVGVPEVVPLFPCTHCDTGMFSHRRGDTGRQGLIAGPAQ